MNSVTFVFEAIGTTWQIDIGDIGDHAPIDIEEHIKNRIETFDKTYSRFRSDSIISQASKKSGVYQFPEDAQTLFATYKHVYDVTNGAFTPLIGDVLVDAGYDAEYSLQTKEVHKPSSWEDVVDYYFPKVMMKKPAVLDFGAGGKGYLVDIIGELLNTQGIHSFVIDASGDILYREINNKPLRIGLEHPENPEQALGVITITDGSVCGSAGNRRKWNKYHHIINPKTLTSPQEIRAVWTVAKTALLADCLATALFLVPSYTLTSSFEFEYAIVKDDYRIEKSPNFPGEFFYN